MNFTIAAVTGMRNRGVEAAVVTTVDGLMARFPAANITIISQTPEYDVTRLRPRSVSLRRSRSVQVLPEEPSLKWGCREIAGSREPYVRSFDSPSRFTRVPSRLIADSSALLLLGGDTLSPDCGPETLLRYLGFVEQAYDAKVPVIFLAQSMSRFASEEAADRFVRAVRRAALYTAREPITRNYLIELGLDPSCIHLTADPSFLLELPGKECRAALAQHYCLPGEAKIALCPGQGTIYEPQPHREAWVRLTRLALEQTPAVVILVPHAQNVQAAKDDRILTTEIARELGYPARLRLIGGDHTASELKSLLGDAELVVTERILAGVGALSLGVPTVLVSYSINSKGLMDRIGGSLADDYLLPLKDFMEEGLARSVFLRAWSRRREFAAHLSAVVPEVRREAMLNFDLVEQALRKARSSTGTMRA